MSRPALAVVTDAAWMVQELASGSRAQVRQLPPWRRTLPEPGERVWAPTDWLMRARASRWQGPLGALGWDWLGMAAACHPILTRRQVLATTLGAAAAGDFPRFIKPAEAKFSGLPARVYASPVQLHQALERHGPDLRVLSQQVLEPLQVEHRVHVIDSVPAGSSIYLRRDADGRQYTWDQLDPLASRDDPRALSFAAAVLDRLPHGPAGLVLDVGQLFGGTWVLIEANPAFSSAPYHVDPAVVVATIMASQRQDPRWAWDPDPVLAAAARPLR